MKLIIVLTTVPYILPLVKTKLSYTNQLVQVLEISCLLLMRTEQNQLGSSIGSLIASNSCVTWNLTYEDCFTAIDMHQDISVEHDFGQDPTFVSKRRVWIHIQCSHSPA